MATICKIEAPYRISVELTHLVPSWFDMEHQLSPCPLGILSVWQHVNFPACQFASMWACELVSLSDFQHAHLGPCELVFLTAHNFGDAFTFRPRIMYQPAVRTVLTPAAFPKAHLKRYAPNCFWGIEKLAFDPIVLYIMGKLCIRRSRNAVGIQFPTSYKAPEFPWRL